MTEERKVGIICSKGTLDMAYPGLVLANAARMEGIEVVMFFTFWGMDIVTKNKQKELKFVPIGNPSTGMPNFVAGLPGITNMATSMMRKQIDGVDMPPVDEFLEMIHDSGAEIYACRMSVDMMNLTDDDFVPEVDGVIGAMEMFEKTEGAQIIFI
ncbi:MAG: DsrE/DsrF/DrsH-like family protein [Chloroflexota bacterium]|nr:DsrE/DsrF/DrsH-like family protein [Chloroflexota bacterium]